MKDEELAQRLKKIPAERRGRVIQAIIKKRNENKPQFKSGIKDLPNAISRGIGDLPQLGRSIKSGTVGALSSIPHTLLGLGSFGARVGSTIFPKLLRTVGANKTANTIEKGRSKSVGFFERPREKIESFVDKAGARPGFEGGRLAQFFAGPKINPAKGGTSFLGRTARTFLKNAPAQTAFDIGLSQIQEPGLRRAKSEAGFSLIGQFLGAGFASRAASRFPDISTPKVREMIPSKTTGLSAAEQKFRTSAKTSNVLEGAAGKVSIRGRVVSPSQLVENEVKTLEDVASFRDRMKRAMASSKGDKKFLVKAEKTLKAINKKEAVLKKAAAGTARKQKLSNKISNLDVKMSKERISKITLELGELSKRSETHGLDAIEWKRMEELENELSSLQNNLRQRGTPRNSSFSREGALGRTKTNFVRPEGVSAATEAPFKRSLLNPEGAGTKPNTLFKERSGGRSREKITSLESEPKKAFDSKGADISPEKVPVRTQSLEKNIIESGNERLISKYNSSVKKIGKGKKVSDFTLEEERALRDEVQKKINDLFDANVKDAEGKDTTSVINNDVLRSMRHRLIQSGESGKELAETIDRSNRQGLIAESKMHAGLDDVFAELNEKEIARFQRAAEGNIPTEKLSPAERKALDLYRRIMKSTLDEAQAAGLVVGEVENYFPRIIKKELSELFGDRNALAKAIAKRGNLSMGDAKTLSERVNQTFGAKKKFFEQQRLADELPEFLFETNPKAALPIYASVSARRIADAKNFGAANEKILDSLSKIAKEGGDVKTASQVILKVLNPLQLNDFTTKLLGYNAITKLPLVSLRNIMEFAQPATRNGLFNAFFSGLESLTKSGRRKAARIGANSKALTDAREILTGAQTRVSKKFMKAYGYQTTQQFADNVEVLSGARKGRQLLKEVQKNPDNLIARKALENAAGEENIVDILSGKVKGEELDRVFGVKTMLDTRPEGRIDLPLLYHTNTGRGIGQFKSFAYKFGTMLRKEILEAPSKSIAMKKLATFFLVANMTGEGYSELRDDIRLGFGKKRRRDSLAKFLTSEQSAGDISSRVFNNLLNSGGFGLVGDMFNVIQFGGYRASSYLGSLLGPAASDLERAFTAGSGIVNKVSSGDLGKKDLEKAASTMMRVAPFYNDILNAAGGLSKNIKKIIPKNIFPEVEAKGTTTGSKQNFTSAMRFILEGEGFSETAYPDAGATSIGFGTRANGRTKISRQDALKEAAQASNKNVRYITSNFPSLSGNQVTALASFMYNLGRSPKGSEKLYKAIKDNDIETIKSEWLRFNQSEGAENPGLVKRRQRELDKFIGAA